MDDVLQALLQRLQEAVRREDFIGIAEDAVEALQTHSDSLAAVEPILRLMEDHTDVDFGMPGPLVHFVERFFGRGYEDRLLESLRRRPTRHTVWMLNRVINGVRGPQKLRYVGELKGILVRPGVDDETRALAQALMRKHTT
jgi:hypothetical protein